MRPTARATCVSGSPTSGFAEVAFDSPDGFIFGVGVHRLARAPDPFVPDVQMFEFIGSENWR